jgi:hypothetical protein
VQLDTHYVSFEAKLLRPCATTNPVATSPIVNVRAIALGIV